eukprot:scaffold626_cov409-Prasinococcus_capsulatus_cf.AAC.30
MQPGALSVQTRTTRLSVRPLSHRYSSMLAEKNKPGSTEEAPSHAHTGVAGDAGGLQSPETGGSKQATEASPSTENRNEGGLASDYASRLPFTPDCPPGLEYVLEGRCRGVRQVGIGRYESRIVFNNIHYALVSSATASPLGCIAVQAVPFQLTQLWSTHVSAGQFLINASGGARFRSNQPLSTRGRTRWSKSELPTGGL